MNVPNVVVSEALRKFDSNSVSMLVEEDLLPLAMGIRDIQSSEVQMTEKLWATHPYRHVVAVAFLASDHAKKGGEEEGVGVSLPIYDIDKSSTLPAVVIGQPYIYSHYASSASSPPPQRSLQVDFPWIYITYLYAEAGNARKSMREMYIGIEELLDGRELGALNRILVEIDLERLPVEGMIGLLRATSRAKRALPAWKSLFLRMQNYSRQKQIPNWEKLFIGLTI